MPKKRSKNPALKAFGQRLLALRGKRSRRQVSMKLEGLGVPLDESSLFQYEAGAVWAPDACVLWGLSVIYGLPLLTLVDLLRANRVHTDADDWRTLVPTPAPAAAATDYSAVLPEELLELWPTLGEDEERLAMSWIRRLRRLGPGPGAAVAPSKREAAGGRGTRRTSGATADRRSTS